MAKAAKREVHRKEPPQLRTPTALGESAREDISTAINALLADSFALYVKTKNFHWHVSGPHFRDYHRLFDEQAAEILEMTDELAERVRKLGGTTLRSISHIAKVQRFADNDADYVTPQDMLAELREDNLALVERLRETHELCEEHRDLGTNNLLEELIDEAEERAWFLFEAGRGGEVTRH